MNNTLSMKNIRPEDLGSMAESYFKILCKSAGLIANNSDDDKGGWDYVVEHLKDNAIDYSSRSYPVYRIQVKSTQSTKNQIQITYSNLLKLIEYTGASFIILFKYSDSIDPNKAFLFHIDESFSREVLIDIRQKQLKNTDFPLHKRKKSIDFNKAKEINLKNSNALVSELQNSINTNYLQYIQQKTSYLSGFEKEGLETIVNISCNTEPDMKAMANCFLGYQEDFHIDMETYRSPFGIKDAYPSYSKKGYKTTIIPIIENTNKAKIYIRHSKFGLQFEFAGTLFNVPRELPEEVQKMRIDTSFFSLMYSPYSSKISIEFKDILNKNIKAKFKELYNYFCILNNFQKSSSLYSQP